jgi:hypothetical protein
MATATGRHSRRATRLEKVSRLPLAECELLRKRYPNVLISGPTDAMAAALAELEPFFRPSVLSWSLDSPLSVPPATSVRTFILHEVASLSSLDQHRLLAWLQQNSGATQVVATTSLPLLPLVDLGAFDGTLYYTLNVVYLEVAA